MGESLTAAAERGRKSDDQLPKAQLNECDFIWKFDNKCHVNVVFAL
jgi:hypothetical protein